MRNLFNNKKICEFNPSIFRIIIVLGLINFFCYSCMWTQSNLNQITSEEMTCDVNKTKASEYYNKYGKGKSNISAYSDSIIQKAFEKLSNVPEQYLEFVFVTHNTTMELTDNNAGGGFTYTTGEGRDLAPISIHSDLWCLAHEFGHASEGYFRSKGKNSSSFGSDLSNISQIIANKYQGDTSQYLASYAYSDKSSRDAETFAELFDTWYCSEAARNKIKKGMPEIYEFAKKYLPLPDGSSSVDTTTTKNDDDNTSTSTSTSTTESDSEDHLNDSINGLINMFYGN